MAKMFYSLAEASEKLGISEQQIKDMAADGKLQQFRDRDKLMFKRDQIEALAVSDDSGSLAGGPIPLADSGDTDAIDVKTETAVPSSTSHDSRQGTGVSVFDAGEVDQADPMAQTQVTSHIAPDDDLSLDSVGSGSGLLDLTREADDTSLGAELLDEIYPGSEGSDSRVDSAVGSSGVFEGALTETGVSGPSGLENLEGAIGAEPSAVMPVSFQGEAYDPGGSGMGVGFLLGTTVAMALVLIIVVSAVAGVSSPVTDYISSSTTALWGWVGGLAVGSLLFGVIGMVIGKATSK